MLLIEYLFSKKQVNSDFHWWKMGSHVCWKSAQMFYLL